MDLPRDSLVMAHCLRRISRWRVPPNWTSAEWTREMQAESAGAFWRACCDFDPSRLVPFEVFARQRILSAALTRYRREWTFCLRCRLGDEAVGDREAPDSLGCSEREQLVREILGRLPVPERRLMNALFWDGETEFSVADRYAVTQQAISKRKREVLKDLRNLLATAARGVKVCGAFLSGC
jgi:DNA-directed RNA polymerase specialized sigma subunit